MTHDFLYGFTIYRSSYIQIIPVLFFKTKTK
ncbi:UNVERIFIED_CONTAM: hypothetical protein NCL1_50186 [Trichonephila clavipes]